MACAYNSSYLNAIPKSDGRSFVRSTLLKEKPSTWHTPTTQNNDGVPMADFVRKGKGDYSVLTVGKLGDWHGKMKTIPFPVQAVDALRDVVYNVLWHTQPESERGATLALAYFTLRDDSQAKLALASSEYKQLQNAGVTSMSEVFQKLGVNPIAWVSRFSRAFMIQNAQFSVYLR
jgi:hypothetical protein